MEFLKNSMQSSSNLARDKVQEKSTPSAKESISMVALVEEDKVLLARSH